MSFPHFLLVCIAGLLLNPTGTQAQKSVLFGRVTDAETAESVPGARVILEGTGNGAIADWEGKFEVIGIRKGTYQLLIESEGYFSDTIRDFRIKEKFREENFKLKLIPCVPRVDPVVKSGKIITETDSISIEAGKDGISVEIKFLGRWGDEFKLFRTWGIRDKEIILNLYRTKKVDCEPTSPFPDPFYEHEFSEEIIFPEPGEYRIQLRSDDSGKELFLKRILVQTF